MDNHVKDTLRRLEQDNTREDHLRAFLENGAGGLSPLIQLFRTKAV